MDTGPAREPTADERAVLDGLLAHDFPGVGELREQLAGLRVAPGCDCGCGSIALVVTPGTPRSAAASPVPVEGLVTDQAGQQIGGVMLWLDDGRLASIEVHSWEGPMPMPPVSRVRWDAGES